MKKRALFAGAAAVIFNSCAEVEVTPEIIPGDTNIYVTERGSSSGVLGVVTENVYAKMSVISSDAAVVTHGEDLYVLGRMEANITKYTQSGAVVYQERIKAGWNAHDLVIVNDTKGYICSNSADEIAVFDPSTGVVSAYIDISSFGTDVITTNATKMELVDGSLYVACQMREGWGNGANSTVLKINTATDRVETSYVCNFANVWDLDYSSGALYVSSTATWGEQPDGGVDRIDLATGTVTTVITGAEVGGEVNEIAIDAANGVVYAGIYKKWGVQPVVKYSFPSFTPLDTIEGVVQSVGLQFDDLKNKLYFGEAGGDVSTDYTTVPGVVVYDAAENSVKKEATSFAPSSLAFITESTIR